MIKRFLFLFRLAGLLALGLSLTAQAAEQEANKFVCGTIHPDTLMKQLGEAVARGEMIDQTLYPAPAVTKFAPRSHDSLAPKTPITPADMFLFEDSAGLLLTNFSDGAAFGLMTKAANALIARDGDQWDFISFFTNFTPHHTIGAAFYLFMKNNVDGLGLGFFDNHGFFGLSGTKVQGYVMMWNMASWDAVNSDRADFTHLVLGQEFMHRFGMFLPATDNGLILQGDDASCGRGGHWNFKVDGQGSGMEIQEWVGSSPATLDDSLCIFGDPNFCFNKDIGGVWSYSDLYLMGYVTPAEMDAGNSELRYMDDACASPYSSTITSFNSSNIIATAGERSPDAGTAQHSFRTAWIVLYQPGKPPSTGQLQRASDILTEWTDVWHFSSLNRGFLDNSIDPPFVMQGDPTPNFIPSLDTIGFNVQVTDSVGTHNPSSGLLHYSVKGGPYSTSPLTSLGGGTYNATLPATPCEDRLDFYVSFESSDGSTVISEPIGSSATPHSTLSLNSDTLIFSDDFETDLGWTVGFTGDAATTGIWTRVDPIGTGAQPEDDNDTGSGTVCYVTGQGTPYPGGYLGENDVDGGRTSLISPAFDLAGKNGVIRYARWYSNNAGFAPETDKMAVSISNDNGVTFPETLEVVTENQLGWVFKQFVVNQFITPASQMKVRFEASDLGAGSLVEAGVDDFQVFVTDISAKPGDANASGTYSLADIIAAVNYIFNKPGFPACGSNSAICWLSDLLCRGNWNGDSDVTLADVIRGVNYLFNKPGGPWNPVPVGACCKSI